MKPQIVAVPNSISDAIDEMASTGALERTSAEVLKLLSIWGWNDGFASVRRAQGHTVFGLRPEEMKRVFRDLAARGLIQMRDAGECHAIEVISLAMNGATPGFAASWWRYHHVEMDAKTEDDGP